MNNEKNLKEQELENKGAGISILGRIFSLPTLISFAIAVSVIIFITFRFNLDWTATWLNIKTTNLWLYILGFIFYYLSFLFRGARWRMLAHNASLDKEANVKVPSTLQCSQFILLGWFVNTVTWFRLGDAYRAYEFSRASKSNFPRVIGTVVAERVLDMVTVFVLMITAAMYLSLDHDLIPSVNLLIASTVMVISLIFLLLLMNRFGMKLSRWLPQKLQEIYRMFHTGTIGSFKGLPLVLLLGLIGWGLEVGRLFFVIEALGLDVRFSLILFVALASSLLSTIPVTPGGLGVVEPGIIGILMLSLDRPDSVSIALMDRSISYASIVILGGILFAFVQIKRSILRRKSLNMINGTRS